MQIITLTSDIGLKDFYIASVKGSLYSKIPSIVLVDITHDIKPFDVSGAAFQVRSSFENFPDGTIHIIDVDSEPFLPHNINAVNHENLLAYPSILKFKNQYFITNDNGFIGAFLGEEYPQSLYRYQQIEQEPEKWSFMMRDCFIELANNIIQKKPFESYCNSIDSYKKAFVQNPIINENLIQGHVIHIDTFGNIITNITRSDFERFGKDTPFVISYQKKVYDLNVISKSYNDVVESECVAIFNHNNHLEIAINRGANGGNGGANQLFGIRLGEGVRVTFYPAGSAYTLSSII